MTPLDLYLVVSAFILLLWVLTLVFEQTESGKRFIERGVRFVLESRR